MSFRVEEAKKLFMCPGTFFFVYFTIRILFISDSYLTHLSLSHVSVQHNPHISDPVVIGI
jgi:hypothetical protein